MRIELVNIPKDRDGSAPGDDVPLIIPGQAFGVFDGATDALGSKVGGVPVGRLAALTAAGAVVAAISDPVARAQMDAQGMVAAISAKLALLREPLGLPIPPSTTAAVVLDLGDHWRFLTQGDSGIRLNGTELLRSQKIIDDVSMVARVAIFNDYLATSADLDAVEMAARRGILLGLGTTIEEGRLSAARAEAIIERAVTATGLEAAADQVRRFLIEGIKSQHRFANTSGHALSFDTLNGDAPQLGHVIDVTRAKSEISSIEIFSDGYSDQPAEVSIAAWEAGFHAAETTDYHRTKEFAAVKGSTRTEFFDDRTVVILSDLN